MTKRLLCLNVELLYAIDRTTPIYSYRDPKPKLCSAFVTQQLINTIKKAGQLIDENELTEVAVECTEVNWFSALDERFFQAINSTMHITKDSLYYSGAFAPQTTPVFVSTRLPLSCVLNDDIAPTKELNVAFLSKEIARVLIDEIINLDREMQIAWNRQESLEELNAALTGLQAASIVAKNTKTDELASEVNSELKQLMKEAEQLETTIEKKCEILCKRVLGISIGDRVVTQSRYKNKNQVIQVESVRYYEGTLYLDGPKILQNGKLGKRHESAYVNLLAADEHK